MSFSTGYPLVGAESDHRPSKDMYLYDDFLGDVLADQWNAAAGSAGTAFAHNAQEGGVVRGVTGATSDRHVNDRVSLATIPFVRCDRGPIVFDARVYVSAITFVTLNVGLTDVHTIEVPFTYDVTTWTSNAADAACFVFDTGATTDEIHVAGVANGTDAMSGDTSIGTAPTAATFHDYRIIIDTNGTAYFYFDGQYYRKLDDAVTTSTLLTPVVAAGSEGTVAARNIDVDYMRVHAYRS